MVVQTRTTDPRAFQYIMAKKGKGNTIMAKYDYNVIVIGAGSAGLVSSYIVAAAKGKVALVERHKMGGDCLNTGCVPSKAIIRSASFMRDVRRAESLGMHKREFGWEKRGEYFDFARVMERVSRIIKAIEPHDSVERFTKLGVDCIAGEAAVKSPHEVEIGGKTYSARSIIVAAGASPFVPPITGLEKTEYRTSDTIWDIREQPRRLMVVGGGPIGSELAQTFAYLGSEVTQVEGGPRILAREDEDASAVVTEHFRDAGVNMLCNSQAREVVVENGEKKMRVADKITGETRDVPFDLLLLAVGRKPNGGALPGLAEAGVKVDERGAVKVNAFLQTDVPSIFACGDIIGSYQFTHTAGHAAFYAAVNAMSFPPFRLKVDWSTVPWCTFTHPEVARVGLSEQEAKKQGVKYEVVKYGIDDLDRAIADEEAHGFVKLLTEPGRKGKLLGVTIVGDHAGDLLHEYVLAMRKKLSVNDILGTIHIYPTLAEANKLAAGNWKKERVSPRMLSLAEKINRFLRGG